MKTTTNTTTGSNITPEVIFFRESSYKSGQNPFVNIIWRNITISLFLDGVIATACRPL